MEIKNYDVLINEKQASCGVVVDPTEYDISFFKDEFLHYEIDVEKKCLNVFSEKNKITFCKIDNKFMYYAYKTETFIIFIGARSSSNAGSRHFSDVYEACIV